MLVHSSKRPDPFDGSLSFQPASKLGNKNVIKYERPIKILAFVDFARFAKKIEKSPPINIQLIATKRYPTMAPWSGGDVGARIKNSFPLSKNRKPTKATISGEMRVVRIVSRTCSLATPVDWIGGETLEPITKTTSPSARGYLTGLEI